MPVSLGTLLVGFGRIAAGYAQDLRMAEWFPYSTHAQVLRTHPSFEWLAVVDPDPFARADAIRDWSVREVVADMEQLADPSLFEVAVIATPPDNRLGLLEYLPNLKAVIVEKPLGVTGVSAERFLNICAERDILVQVNFPRRGDSEMRRLAASLPKEIGRAQAAFSLYGNGINNNGSHIVDWAQMFLGEVKWVRAIQEGPLINESPILGDRNFPFVLGFASGVCLMAQPLTFSNFRENSLEIWGERGRLSFWQEGLTATISPRTNHRFLTTNFEIASDCPDTHLTGQGEAIYGLYDNLARAIKSGETLWSSGQAALGVMKVMEAIQHSFTKMGSRVEI